MRWIRGLVLAAFAVTILLPGCGPDLTKEQLGTIEYRVPKVPGSEEPYPLPPPGPKTKDESASSGQKELPLPPSDGGDADSTAPSNATE